VVYFDAVDVFKFAELVFCSVFHRGDDRLHEDDGTEALVVELQGWGLGEIGVRSPHAKEISSNPLPNLEDPGTISFVDAGVDARVVNGGGL
jgi:hypothetical protein